jgi:tRNA A37 methylthiotransferase MiaB
MDSGDKKVIFFGEKSKRSVASAWSFDVSELTPEKVLGYIQHIKKGYSSVSSSVSSSDHVENPEVLSVIEKEIDTKIGGYRSQDIKKGLYDEIEFVDKATVLDLMLGCQNACYYCRQPVKIAYETSREPKQWSLERIDNSIGHTKNNVVIACLHCNLTRKTMYHERFAFTKQLTISKTL